MNRASVFLLALAVTAAACGSAPKKTGYVGPEARMRCGRHVDRFWSDGSTGSLTRIRVGSISTGHLEDTDRVTVAQCREWLEEALFAEDPDSSVRFSRDAAGATATMDVALTYVDPGSGTWRIALGEFGAGQSSAQIEGAIRDASGKTIATFAHRNRSAGNNQYRDLERDDSANLVREQIRCCVVELRREIEASPRP